MKSEKGKVEDIGFSTIGSPHTGRSINKDGSFNVVKTGSQSFFKDKFHYLISVDNKRFLGILILYYTLVNLCFGFVYYVMGASHFTIAEKSSEWHNFLDGLFFSFQTFGTIGYGYISPVSVVANSIVVFEIFLGMISMALLAGIVYSRFSKPKTRILFSDNVIFYEKDPIYTTMKFKLVNKRNSLMIDTEVKVAFALRDVKTNRITYNTLKLQVDKITFFPLTWTVVHLIDETSPLYKITKEDAERLTPELLIRVKGFDDKYHQDVYANFSYQVKDWIWNKKFERNFVQKEDGMMHLDVNDVHKFE